MSGDPRGRFDIEEPDSVHRAGSGCCSMSRVYAAEWHVNVGPLMSDTPPLLLFDGLVSFGVRGMFHGNSVNQPQGLNWSAAQCGLGKYRIG